MHVMRHIRRRIHACYVSYEEEDTFRPAQIVGFRTEVPVYMHVMCHMRRRIPSAHRSQSSLNPYSGAHGGVVCWVGGTLEMRMWQRCVTWCGVSMY